MATPPNLPTNHVDNIKEIIHGSTINDIAAGVNSLSTQVTALQSQGTGPSGPAGGVLAGTYPNPSLAAGAATGAALGSDVATLSAGLVLAAELGSGTASSSTFLRGDRTWATPIGLNLAAAAALSTGVLGLDHTATPATSLQAQINSATAGSTLTVAPGIYRETVTIDKNLTVDFNNAASLKGSDVWGDDSWVQPSQTGSAEVWESTVSIVTDTVDSNSAPGSPESNFKVMVFYDHLPLTRVRRRPRAGEWAVIINTGKIMLGSNPYGHLVEVSRRRCGFNIGSSSSNNAITVTLKNADVRHCMSDINPPGSTADGGIYVSNQKFVLTGSTVAYNHGAGSTGHLNAGSDINGNTFAYNGGIGGNWSQDYIAVGSYPLSNMFIRNNSFHHNNTLGYNWNYSGGAFKMTISNHCQITGNLVYANNGPGIWLDILNTEATVQNNFVWRNEQGLRFEISGKHTTSNVVDYTGSATDISSNVFMENGWNDYFDGSNNGEQGSGLDISTSVNVNVHDNILAWDYMPISVLWDFGRNGSLPTGNVNNPSAIQVYNNKIIWETQWPNGQRTFNHGMQWQEISSSVLFGGANVGGYGNQLYPVNYSSVGATGDGSTNLAHWNGSDITTLAGLNAVNAGNLGANGASSYISTTAWTGSVSAPVMPTAVATVLSGASAAGKTGALAQPQSGHGQANNFGFYQSDSSSSVTSNTTLYGDEWDKNVFVDATSGAVQITMPPSTLYHGKDMEVFVVKVDSSANAVTIVKNPGSLAQDSINGPASAISGYALSAGTITLSSQYAGATLVSRGAGWLVKSVI